MPPSNLRTQSHTPTRAQQQRESSNETVSNAIKYSFKGYFVIEYYGISNENPINKYKYQKKLSTTKK